MCFSGVSRTMKEEKSDTFQAFKSSCVCIKHLIFNVYTANIIHLLKRSKRATYAATKIGTI